MEFSLKTKKEKRNYILMTIPLFIALAAGYVWLAFFADGQSNPISDTEIYFYGAFIFIFFPISMLRSWRKEGYRDGRVVLTNEGVYFSALKNNHFMYWEEVEYVVIVKLMKNCQIRFFTADYKNDTSKLPYCEYPIARAKSIRDSYIFMPYSKEALEEVKKHFDKKVTNEYILHLKGVGK